MREGNLSVNFRATRTGQFVECKFGDIPLSFQCVFQAWKGNYDESIDTARLFEIVRNIVYWLGSRGLWSNAYANSDDRADKHGSANEYAFANEYSTTNSDSNAYEYSCTDEYCHTDCNPDQRKRSVQGNLFRGYSCIGPKQFTNSIRTRSVQAINAYSIRSAS